MKTFRKIILLITSFAISTGLSYGQHFIDKKETDVHLMSETYQWPTDPEVLEKLDKWQDLKFGVIFHWGLYSVEGINESWPLCSEERFYDRRKKIQPDLNYEEFKQWYWSLSNKFNPTEFNPKKWAEIMADAGMKYIVFTTKHHEGFCMFDTRTTDFSIAKGPFKNNPLKDVTYHVFDEFRKKDFMIGAYFSKPDWHNQFYWNPDMATPDRNVNYNIKKHPDWWNKFKNFTAQQIDELTTKYGRVDILWLDGGQVRPENGQDIDLDKIIEKARKTQKGMLAVDRTVPGKNENYATPEMRIPPKQLNYPWESNIQLTKGWGWRKNTEYKSSRWIINTLIEITAKGGSFLVGIGPTPQGTIEEEAIVRLKETGLWLKDYGKAIYSTRITPNYNNGNTWFTASKDNKTIYAIYALPEGEKLPKTISWKGNKPKGSIRNVKTNMKVKYSCDGDNVTVTLPEGLKNEPIALYFNKQ